MRGFSSGTFPHVVVVEELQGVDGEYQSEIEYQVEDHAERDPLTHLLLFQVRVISE